MTTHSAPGWGATHQRAPRREAARGHGEALATWAMAMVPALGLTMIAAYFIGNALMNATGTPEGALLTSRGAAGMAAWVLVNLIVLSAPITGVVLAVLARRRAAGPRATTALVMNGGIVVYFTLAAIANLFLS